MSKYSLFLALFVRQCVNSFLRSDKNTCAFPYLLNHRDFDDYLSSLSPEKFISLFPAALHDFCCCKNDEFDDIFLNDEFDDIFLEDDL